MAKLNVTTKTAEEVWSSPDKKITIFKVGLEYEGKSFTCKTYSKAIATPGWSGEVESYEKPGRNGSETFVKQSQKEGGWSGGGGGAKREQDPYTMYLSYAKDLAGFCTVTTAKGVVFDSTSYAEMLAAVEAGGAQLYAGRPGAESTVEKVFPGAKAQEVSDEPTVSDEEIDSVENTGLPL